MNRTTFFILNIFIYWALVTGLDVLEVGSFGTIFALLTGGIFFSLLAIIIEPLLAFFKFPSNFWALLLIGFLLNLLFFFVLSTGIFPALVLLKPGVFGGELSPLPFFRLTLSNSFFVAAFAALLATTLQIVVRKLGE